MITPKKLKLTGKHAKAFKQIAKRWNCTTTIEALRRLVETTKEYKDADNNGTEWNGKEINCKVLGENQEMIKQTIDNLTTCARDLIRDNTSESVVLLQIIDRLCDANGLIYPPESLDLVELVEIMYDKDILGFRGVPLEIWNEKGVNVGL